MKTVNAFLAGLAALAVTSQASAVDISIRITGSTAFRSNTHTALTTATPTGMGFTQTAFTSLTASNGATTASGAKYAIYERVVGADKIIIKTSWTGSVGAIQALAQQRDDVKWLPDIGTGGVTAGAGSPGNNETLAVKDLVPADFAFSDCFQDSTDFKFPQYPKLFDLKCGINQFRMVTNYGAAGVNPITSINSQQVRALFTAANGLPLSMFTGNPADTTKVYGIGRDPDSGTRVTLLAETGMGSTATVIHWSPTATGNFVTALAPWPATTLFDIPYAVGNGGYASGGDLAKVMRLDTSSVSVNGGTAAPCYFVAAVSKGDADTVIAGTGGAGNGKVIKFNNTDDNALTSAQVADNIKNGVYSLWGYLHCMRQETLPEGAKKNFYDEMTALLINSTSSNIKLSDMKVQRLIDGATATAN